MTVNYTPSMSQSLPSSISSRSVVTRLFISPTRLLVCEDLSSGVLSGTLVPVALSDGDASSRDFPLDLEAAVSVAEDAPFSLAEVSAPSSFKTDASSFIETVSDVASGVGVDEDGDSLVSAFMRIRRACVNTRCVTIALAWTVMR